MSDPEEMPKHPRLTKRGDTYWHRAAVPTDIRTTYPKREETFSLKTKDPREAIRLVRIAAADVDRRFDAHRRSLRGIPTPQIAELSPDQQKALRAAYFRYLLEEDEETRLQGFVRYEDTPSGRVISRPLHDNPRDTFEEHVESGEEFGADTRNALARGLIDDFWASEVDEVLSWGGIDLNLAPASPARAKAARALQEAAVEAAEAKRRRNLGDVVDTPPAAPTAALSASPMLSAAVTQWVAEKTLTWGPKAAADNRSWLSTFLEIVGDKPLADYRKADGVAFKGILQILPPNAKKRKELRGLSTPKAAEKANSLGLAPMSVANINKAIGRIIGFWGWAEGHFENIPACPLKSMKMKDGRARDKRHPLTNEQLQSLFSGPVYAGCRSPRFAASPGRFTMSGHWKFWLPLLGLFTGARANELGQLRPADVMERDGVAYLDIREDDQGQRVKEAASNRQIPIHRQLIHLGFLELAADQKRLGAERLFTGLRRDANGYFSDAISDYFSGHLKALGIKTPKTSFHSLRHNFQDACRFAEIEMQITEAIAGREEGRQGGNYGKGQYSLRQLDESLQRIAYPELDLSGLPHYGDRSKE